MKVGRDVLGVVSRLEVRQDPKKGFVAAISDGQLERKLYVKFDEAMNAIGGKWDRYAKGHVFKADPSEAMDGLLLSGGVTTAREMGFFQTPEHLAERIVDLANITEDTEVLEPSAGEGRLALAARRSGGLVHCVEIDPERAQKLRDLGFSVECGDFLTSGVTSVDVVIMNPPFGRKQDVDHVARALGLLHAGGQLVAIMAAGFLFREDRKTVQLRERILAHGTAEELPPGTFRTEGTDVNTVLVSVRRPT